MRHVVAAFAVAFLVVSLPLVVSGQASKGQCDTLNKAVADAQTEYSKAWAAFNAAARVDDTTQKQLDNARKALSDWNRERQGIEADIANCTTQLESCRDRHPGVGECVTEQGRLDSARARLEKHLAKKQELEFDLAAAEQATKEAEADLEAAHKAANAAKAALDKAKAARSAANCPKIA